MNSCRKLSRAFCENAAAKNFSDKRLTQTGRRCVYYLGAEGNFTVRAHAKPRGESPVFRKKTGAGSNKDCGRSRAYFAAANAALIQSPRVVRAAGFGKRSVARPDSRASFSQRAASGAARILARSAAWLSQPSEC